MLFVAVFILLAVSGTGYGQKCDCGRGNTGGGEYPMMAAIQNIATGRVFCGATIISDRYAITAAHCFLENKSPNALQLLVGGNDYSKEKIKIAKIIAHEDYEVMDNDIALVHLSTPIQFNENTGPACLPFELEKNLFGGETVAVLGWSKTQGPKNVNVVSKDLCQKWNASNSDTKICTFVIGPGDCTDHSGGAVLRTDPHTSKLTLIGIASLAVPNRACKTSDYINTRVASFLKWINTHTNSANFCT